MEFKPKGSVYAEGRGRFPQPPSMLSPSGSDKEMNIKYHKLPDDTRPEGVSFYPLLQVFLRHDVNMQNILALVDSGSVDCVFPASIGQLLGVDIASGTPHKFHGFDLGPVQGYVHRISLQVAGFSHWIDFDAVFLESEGMPILGQNGFFDSYQVIFERWARQFEINSKTDAMIRNRRGYGRKR